MAVAEMSDEVEVIAGRSPNSVKNVTLKAVVPANIQSCYNHATQSPHVDTNLSVGVAVGHLQIEPPESQILAPDEIDTETRPILQQATVLGEVNE